MKRDHFKKWLQNIYNTQEQEISCSECFHWVSHYVDVELSGNDPAGQMPQVRLHLDQCSACREEYETLRDFKRLEDQDDAPSTDDLRDLIS